MKRQAVILAAGCGRRLGEETEGRAKCLLSVGGRALIDHQLAALAGIGVTDVCVVAGYGADVLGAHLAGRCTIVINPHWEYTNSLYSLWLAREWIRGEFFLLNGDVLAHAEVFHRVAAGSGSCLAYDTSSGNDAEHMKIRMEHGELRSIGKHLPPDEICGENVGILRFDAEAGRLLLEAASTLIAADDLGAWAPAAINRLLPEVKIRCVDVSDLPWVEIDYAEDLRVAREVVWPAIRSSLQLSEH